MSMEWIYEVEFYSAFACIGVLFSVCQFFLIFSGYLFLTKGHRDRLYKIESAINSVFIVVFFMIFICTPKYGNFMSGTKSDTLILFGGLFVLTEYALTYYQYFACNDYGSDSELSVCKTKSLVYKGMFVCVCVGLIMEIGGFI